MELKLAVKGLVMLILQGLIFKYSGDRGCSNHCLIGTGDMDTVQYCELLSDVPGHHPYIPMHASITACFRPQTDVGSWIRGR